MTTLEAPAADPAPTPTPRSSTAAGIPREVVRPPVYLAGGWQEVCRLDDLVPERGAAALLARPTAPGSETSTVQVALVRLLDDTVLAVSNLDPYSGAHVMSRGLVGSRLVDGTTVPTLTSPLHKQVFSLLTGACLDTAGKSPVAGEDGDLGSFPVRVTDGVVHVTLPDDAGLRP